jgi:hypothetical protein
MSQQGGISHSELQSALSRLRQDLEGQIRQVRNELAREISRLENEMREVGEMVVRAIGKQTSDLTGAIDEHKRVLVAGVAATTLMIERTKQQMEADFATTIARIEQQTESALQVEMGKKIADARAINGKLQAFIGDIRSRFDRALLGVNVNRELYSLNFRKIVDDFESKVHTIGSHILQIRDEDIAPAVKAAGFVQEATHGLPMEVDLRRIEARSRNLDQTLALLKGSRLDEVTGSLSRMDGLLSAFSMRAPSPVDGKRLSVEGIAVSSPGVTTVISGQRAVAVGEGEAVRLAPPAAGLEAFTGEAAIRRVALALSGRTSRAVTGKEVVALREAAERLASRGLMSRESVSLLEDFLGSGNLKVMEV